MGFSKVVYLHCDGESPDCECPNREAFGGSSPHTTIWQYQEEVSHQGWRFEKGNKAYCLFCWHHKKKKQNKK